MAYFPGVRIVPFFGESLTDFYKGHYTELTAAYAVCIGREADKGRKMWKIKMNNSDGILKVLIDKGYIQREELLSKEETETVQEDD